MPLKKCNHDKQKGMTLIELMIAVLLAAIVIGATMGFLFSAVKSSIENIKMTRMNQELRGVMSFMMDELRRAGYSTNSASSAMMDILEWDDGNDCLQYAYQNDTSDASASFNTKSFKLNDQNEILYGSVANGDAVCAGSALNDRDIAAITSFDSPIAYIGFGDVSVATLTISLAGQTLHNGKILGTRSVTDVVRLRNELPQ